MARKQIVEFGAAVSVASTDRFLLQQGAVGTDFSHATITQLLNAGLAATYSSVVVNGSAVPGNGMYLPTTNTLGWAVNTTAEMQMTGTALSPATSDGLALGTTALMWSDAFFASGSVLNFNNGDVTITHSADTLTVAGGTLATGALTATTGVFSSTATATAFIPSSATVPTNGMYLPAANTLGWAINSAAEMSLTASALSPAVSDGLALGTTALMWSDAFFASGSVLNFNNGDVTITHAANLLTMAGGGFTLSSSRIQGEFLVETSDAINGAPGIRARGRRQDSNGSVDFGGQFFAEGVRTDALPASGKVFGGLVFGGNTDLTPTMGYTASITAVSDAVWVDTSNAATAIVFRTGTAAQARAANIAYGTDRGRITSGGRWLLGSSTDDASTTVQVNGTFKATGASTLAALTATTGDFTGSSTINLSGTALSSISGLVLGGAAADAASTGVLMDAVAIHPRYVLRRANGTSASKTAVVADDVLGAIEGRGYDGSAFTSSHAGIDFAAAENWSGAARGGKIAFRTTTNGAITGAGVKMTLENSGALLIGGTTDDGVNKLRVSGGVTVDTGNSYKINNVAVVGATKTGWTAATGTATRTTFATTTVTTEQLAQRLKALIDDLISHGLIGT